MLVLLQYLMSAVATAQPSIVIPTVITESGPKSHSGVGGAGVVTSNEVLLADPSCSEQHPVKLGLVGSF